MSQISKLKRDFKKQVMNSRADKIELRIKDAEETIIYTMKKMDDFKKESWRITQDTEFYRDGKLDRRQGPFTMLGTLGAVMSQYPRHRAAKNIAEKATQAKCDGTFISLTC